MNIRENISELTGIVIALTAVLHFGFQLASVPFMEILALAICIYILDAFGVFDKKDPKTEY